MENWKKVYESDILLEVKLIEDILKQSDIVSNIVDKEDRAFPMLSHPSLWVRDEDEKAALEMIRAHLKNQNGGEE